MRIMDNFFTTLICLIVVNNTIVLSQHDKPTQGLYTSICKSQYNSCLSSIVIK